MSGLLHYFTGKPCKRNHLSIRNVNDKSCLACRNLQAKKDYADNPDRFIARVQNSKSKKANEYKQYQRQYRRENLNLYRFHCAKRWTAKLHATPKWANLEDIKLKYEFCPYGLVVDHIVPLQGKRVCGLHVPWNLQYLTKEDNARKYNKLSV
jgi:hypothetical protein